MADEPIEEVDAPEAEDTDEAKVVKFLFSVLDSDEAGEDFRVDAGIVLLGYYKRLRQDSSIGQRAAAAALESSVRATLRHIAMDDSADIVERIRAAGASL